MFMFHLWKQPVDGVGLQGSTASFLGELVQCLEAGAHFFFFFLNACMFGSFCYCQSKVNRKIHKVGSFDPLLYPKLLKQSCLAVCILKC